MMTVNEVSRLAGVSIRTLQYYDKIGLLPPSEYTESGYRLYDDAALEQLQQILLFRELEFPLKEIKKIMSSPAYDRVKALDQQIELLMMKKDHLDKLIHYAKEVREHGGNRMNFQVFDKSKLEEYQRRAKEQWGETAQYKEAEEKLKTRDEKKNQQITEEFMRVFAEFGALKDGNPEDKISQLQVKKLQDYVTEHFYHCTNEILKGLGQMYTYDDEFKTNIDQAGGVGTAEFVTKAIEIYCSK